MKEYSAKTVDECLELASQEAGVKQEELIYRVTEEKKSLFSKKATIETYDINDAVEYAEDYLRHAIGGMNIDIEFAERVEDDIIHITLNSPRNPILIGKNGRTLQGINELTKLAVSNRFHHRFRILLDVGGYKEDKYSRLAYIAKRTANEVLKTHINTKLDPMTPDERRVIHNTLSGMAHIKTESTGEGDQRAVNIEYVEGSDGKANAQPKSEIQPEQPVSEPEAEAAPIEESTAPEAPESEEVLSDEKKDA